MLKPNKFTDINIAVISISAEILKALKKTSVVKYDELFGRVILKKGVKAKSNFLPALNFLFLLNKVKYHKDLDIIELLQ